MTIGGDEALLIIRDRRIFADGHLIDIVVGKVPGPVPPTEHGLKYRLFYGRRGVRVVAADDERGNADHRHVDGHEEPYAFADTRARVLDAVVRAERGEIAGEDHVTFVSWDAIARVMTTRRFELLRRLRRNPEAGVASLAASGATTSASTRTSRSSATPG
ncbi:MAG: DUF6516 family protein [Siculibacillus sp.]